MCALDEGVGNNSDTAGYPTTIQVCEKQEVNSPDLYFMLHSEGTYATSALNNLACKEDE